MIWISIITAAACLFAVFTIVIMYQQKQRQYIILKTITSAGFLLVAMRAGIGGCSREVFVFVMPALILCFLGDVFLAAAHEIDNNLKDPWFTMGVASFAAAQALMSWELARLIDFNFRPTIILSVVMVAIVWYTARSGRWDYGKNKIPSIIYAFLIGLFCGLGLNYIWIMGLNTQTLLFGVGSCLFLISDFTLSCKYFKVTKQKYLGAAVLITYYLATYMIAIYLHTV